MIDFLVFYGQGTVLLTPQHKRASDFLESQLGKLLCKWDRGQVEVSGQIAAPLFEAMEKFGFDYSVPHLSAKAA